MLLKIDHYQDRIVPPALNFSSTYLKLKFILLQFEPNLNEILNLLLIRIDVISFKSHVFFLKKIWCQLFHWCFCTIRLFLTSYIYIWCSCMVLSAMSGSFHFWCSNQPYQMSGPSREQLDPRWNLRIASIPTNSRSLNNSSPPSIPKQCVYVVICNLPRLAVSCFFLVRKFQLKACLPSSNL